MITHALIISLIVLFLHATTWKGHIFEGIKKVIKPEGKLYKPIYGCPICMTPWWGTLIYIWLYTDASARESFGTLFTAAGFSVIWVLIIDIKDNLKKIAQ